MRGKWNGFERKMNANAITGIAMQLVDPSDGNRAPGALIDCTAWGTLHGIRELEFRTFGAW
jgi:hypothetical protein